MLIFVFLSLFSRFISVFSRNVTAGKFVHVYDPSVGEKEKWYINDHTVHKDKSGWHLIGITHAEPSDPGEERFFAHATAEKLFQTPWEKQDYALRYDPGEGETWIWAPHIIEKDDEFYMFYCGGGKNKEDKLRIDLVTSKNLFNWTHYEKNPVFEDAKGARDPFVHFSPLKFSRMVLKIEDERYNNGEELYVLYYCLDSVGKQKTPPVVAYRTSNDLINWGERKIAFTRNKESSYTESPFVVRYKDHYYLFMMSNSYTKLMIRITCLNLRLPIFGMIR